MKSSANKKTYTHDIHEILARLEEAEETLRAIKSGEVDAIVVSGPQGEQVYTLKGADKSYRLLVESMSDGAVTLAPDKTILYSNRRFASMLDMPLENVIGASFHDFIGRQDAQAFERNLAKGMRQGGISFEMELCGKGNAFPAILSASVLQIEDMIAYCMVITDLGEQKKQQEELEKTIKELEQFVFIASHDLQEPLRMVSSYVQLLSERYKDKLGKDADEYIGFAVNGAKQMERLILDLLDYSRIGTRGGPKEETSSQKTLDEAMATLREKIQTNGAQVTYGRLPVVQADPGQLHAVFLNLLDNAIKFRKKEEKPVINVSAEDRGNEWLFSVSDNGIGIEEQYREKVFVIFQKLHGSKYPGTGIGLAKCRKIVERHGGRIWVESEPGKGAAFHFTLPKS